MIGFQKRYVLGAAIAAIACLVGLNWGKRISEDKARTSSLISPMGEIDDSQGTHDTHAETSVDITSGADVGSSMAETRIKSKFADLFDGGPFWWHGDRGGTSLANRSAAQSCFWAHAIFLAADNNLEAAALTDLEEIRKNPNIVEAAKSGEYKLEIMIDRASSTSKFGGHSGDPIPDLGYNPGTEVAHLNPNKDVYDSDQKLGEVNMDDPARLQSFMVQSFKTKCTYQFLELWDHGAGFYGFGGDGADGHNPMTLGPMTQAIKQGLQQVGQPKISILGFDACLMSSYEVLVPMAPMADYILVSEDTEPGHGWDYRTYNPGHQDPLQLGKGLIDGFMKHSTQDPRTLALIDSQKFMSFYHNFDAEMNKLATGINSGQQNLLAAVSRARSGAFDFSSVVGKTDSVDLGAFMAGLQKGGLTQFGSLLTQYNGLFVERKFSQPGYTGIGALFPDPNGASSKSPKFTCYLDRMKGVSMGGWNKFVWAVLSHGDGSPMPAPSCAGLSSGGGGGGAGGLVIQILIALITIFLGGGKMEALKAMADNPDTMKKMMGPPPKSLLSDDLVPWLSPVTVGPEGQMRVYGVGMGTLTDLKLIYGTNHVLGNDQLLVMGTARPSFRYTQKDAQGKGHLQNAPWGDAKECGADDAAAPKDQRCGIFADWIGPTELIQGDKKALVTVLEVHRDDLHDAQSAELVQIPIKYFDQPGCKGSLITGYLKGLIPPAGRHGGDQHLDNWSLVIVRQKGGVVQTEVVSKRVGSTAGSFEAAQQSFDLSKAKDKTYSMGYEMPFADKKDPPTCFDWTDGGLASSAAKPFTLKVHPKAFLPLTVLLRGFDVKGNVKVLTRVTAIPEQMHKYSSGTWPALSFPKCRQTDDKSCGHYCACWSSCARSTRSRTCHESSLLDGYKFEKTDASTSFWWPSKDACGVGKARTLCVATEK